ncbi:hypothetical protein [Oceaniferula spumae]|uniref:hypothetical protein n=1 Tax=Oceaniferula spumae TaxID=2979115 RepID=UPI003F4E6550
MRDTRTASALEPKGSHPTSEVEGYGHKKAPDLVGEEELFKMVLEAGIEPAPD